MTTLYLFIYFLICLYTDWRIEITNEVFYTKNPDFESYKSNTEKFWMKIMILFHGIFFIGTLFTNGLKVLETKRSIFNGEIL